jgi:autotransporter-associated beta strand protein
MKTPKNQTGRVTAILFAAIAAASVFNLESAVAGSRTWNGGATPDGNWTNPGNWNGVAPTNNDLLTFSGSTQTATTNNFPANTPFNNVTFNSGAGPFTINGNAMALSEPTDAGSGQIANGSINNLCANAETFRSPLLIVDGNHKIVSSGGGVLKLNGTITRSNGAVVTMSGNINVAGGLSTNGSLNGILGGWAIYSNNWATLDANSNVIAYAGYTDVTSGTIADNPASNVRIPTAGGAIAAGAGVTRINSLLLSAGNAAQTVGIGAGNTLVLGQNGGIYNSSPIASGGTYRNLTIGANFAAGGILTAGDGVNPATITFGSPPLASGSTGFLTVQSSIRDNGPAPVTLVIAGAYVSLNGSGPGAGTFPTNTYSGGTYILQGRFSQANPYSVGTGPIHIFPGGQMNTGWPITNNFDIEGSGTTENQGMGALRLYSASVANGITGNLPGTIYLRGNANVCADNITAASQLLGFSGKITGPGSLGFGSPTATSRSGVLNIGSTNGAFAIPNDYAGDTLINGINGGTTSTTLRICDPADNNIMPHGSTGSYAGGRTGNLILNANNLQAIFDLNGSTQTVNGLISTARNPVNNIVTDNGPGTGSLVVGDSDASSTYAGVVQNGVSIAKIGNGTITLSGPNTYSGDTVVNAGRLVTTTASTGGGNYSVSNNAALGVTVAGGGQTMNMNTLTLASGSSLQLNAGTFGNPTAAIANVATLAINGTVNISLSGIGLTAGGPFTILTYNPATRSGGGSFTLVNSPRLVATLNDNPATGIVSVSITSADSAIKWNGGVAGNWDINDGANAIWQTVPSGNPTDYIESGSGNDSVIFDDSATGTTSVNLTTTLTPQSLAVTNSTQSYLFAGPGKITGATGLVKAGGNTLTIANGGNNDFSGNILLNAGTLVVSNDWNLANSVSGSGALVKNGPGTLTLSGDNSGFTGPVTVNGGTLSVLASASLSIASSVVVTNTGALDIGQNSVGLGLVPITASGSGVSGNGAIVNSSGYSGGTVATSFQNLTMADDTTIGGPGRLDFTDGTLSSGGLPRKLTKVSISTLRLANLTVDPALGDIEVAGGTLSLQGDFTSLGDPAHNFVVDAGAILQFNGVNSDINKGVVVQNNGVMNSSAGANTVAGAISLQGSSLFNVGGTSLTLNGVVAGAGALTKVTGGSPLILGAANTYTGGTVAGAGLVSFSDDSNLGAVPGVPTPANIVLNGGGISASTDVAVNANRGIAVGPASGSGAGFIDVVSTMFYNGIIANNGAGVGGLIKTNGGTLFLGGASTYTGNTILAQGIVALTGNGSIGASANIILAGGVLDASGRGDGTLTLAAGQTLSGAGTVTGNLTSGFGSTVAPGANTDANISISGTVALQGTNVMNLDKDAGAFDQISGASISYGGTLVLLISNTITPLANNDAFPLYSAGSYAGTFASIIPAQPGPGLAWNTNTLTTDGMLRVTVGAGGSPTTNANISSVMLSGTNLLVHGTNNNVPNTNFLYVVLSSTNLTLPLSNWTPVVTNRFNQDGTFDYTNPIVPGTMRQFIDVMVVP